MSAPLEPGKKFQNLSQDEKAIKIKEYQRIVGCLTYTAITTHAEIAAAVGILAQVMTKPVKTHWEGVKKVLHYTKGNLNYGIMYKINDEKVNLTRCSDADWAGDGDWTRG